MPTEVAPPAPETPPPAVAQSPAGADPPVGGNDGKPPAGDSAAAKPAQPPKAKDHAALARIGARLREERRELKTKGETWEREKTELTAKVGELSKLGEELAALKAERESFLKDPIAFAAKHGGAKAEEAIQKYVNDTTPEKAIQSALEEAAAARREAAEARESLTKWRKEQEEGEVKRQKEQLEAAKQSSVRNFTGIVVREGKKFPYLNAMYSPEEIQAKALEFQAMAEREEWVDEGGRKQVGKAYSFEEVATAFEGFAKRAYDKRQETLRGLLTVPEGTEPGSGPGVEKNPAPGNGRREGKDGPGNSTPPKQQRRLPRTLTREQEAEQDRALLRKAFAADEAALRAPKS